MKDNRDLSSGWLEKARSDLHATERLLDGNGPYDTASFNRWTYLMPLIMPFNCGTILNFGQKKKPPFRLMPWHSKWWRSSPLHSGNVKKRLVIRIKT
jgi:hypothetical protein